MSGFGFGYGASRKSSASKAEGSTAMQTVGALTRNAFGAGIPITGTAIISGDVAGHWTVSDGRLFPSADGDNADLNAGPYTLQFDDGSSLVVAIEADAWDVTDQSEWDFVASQSATTLAGKTIALRNSQTLNLGIDGSFGSPFRRVDLRDGSGNSLTLKGRFGEVGEWDAYCEIDRVATLRGARGVTFQHLKTDAVAESKFTIVGESAHHVDDIVINDCWIRGETGDPNADYSNSSTYPNLNKDLVRTTGSATGAVGNVTVTNCKIEWGDSLVNVRVDRAGSECVITGNELGYFYGDAIGVTIAPSGPLPATINDNFIHDSVGLATDSAGPHVDAIRLISTLAATADWENIQIERNIILQGHARGDMQGIFLDDMKTTSGDSGHFFVATVRGNTIVINRSIHGISIIQAKDCVVENNTVISWDRTSSNPPSILVGSPSLVTGTSGGGNAITDCIADGIGSSLGSLTLSNNFEAGINGSVIDYATLFDGPTFSPTTKAATKSLLNPKVSAGATIA